MSFNLDANLGLYQISMMELFCENSERPKALNFFRKKLHHRCLRGYYIYHCKHGNLEQERFLCMPKYWLF